MKKLSLFSKNLSALTFTKLVNALVPILLLPYLIRVIGLEKQGVIIFAMAITAYFQPLIDYSFNITGVRKLALIQKDKTKIEGYISKVLSVKLLITLFSLLVGLLLVLLFPVVKNERVVFVLTLLSLVPYAFSPYWIFLGLERMKFFAFSSIISRLLLLIFTVSLIHQPSDYWIYPLLTTSMAFLTSILGIYLLIYKLGFKINILFTKGLLTILIGNFKLFINQFLPHLYTSTSVLLLQNIEGMIAVGIFGAIQKVIAFSEVGLKMLSTISFPHLVRNPTKFKKYSNVQLILTLVVVIIVISSHTIIMRILDIDNEVSFSTLTILSIGSIGYMLYDIYGQNYFVRRHEDSFVVTRTLISCIIGFILSFVLVYNYGIIGAALTIAITRLLIGSSMFVSYQVRSKQT